jgi:hypothetical protein
MCRQGQEKLLARRLPYHIDRHMAVLVTHRQWITLSICERCDLEIEQSRISWLAYGPEPEAGKPNILRNASGAICVEVDRAG